MVSNQIREEIRKRYKTDAEFAKKLGWTRQKLSKTIRGERSPKISDINAMSKGLEVSVETVISFFVQ